MRNPAETELRGFYSFVVTRVENSIPVGFSNESGIGKVAEYSWTDTCHSFESSALLAWCHNPVERFLDSDNALRKELACMYDPSIRMCLGRER